MLGEQAIREKDATLPSSEHLLLLEKAVAKALEGFQTKYITQKTPEILAKEAVQYALKHLAEREAAFQHKEVMVVALKRVLGNANLETVQKSVLEAEQKGEFSSGEFILKMVPRWTTLEAIQLEREILQLATKDAGKLESIAAPEKLEEHLQITQPKKDQHGQAIRQLMSHTDRAILIQGFAGTGKTTMLKNVEILLNDQGYELLCLAPTIRLLKN